MDITMILIILCLCVVTVAAMYFLVPALLKKSQENNIPIEKILDSAESIANMADLFLKTLNLDSKYKDMLTLIIQSAQTAVKYAEQLYISNQIPENERKKAAIDFVKLALKDAGIEITSDKELIITAVIESAVFSLPKTKESIDNKTS